MKTRSKIEVRKIIPRKRISLVQRCQKCVFFSRELLDGKGLFNGMTQGCGVRSGHGGLVDFDDFIREKSRSTEGDIQAKRRELEPLSEHQKA